MPKLAAIQMISTTSIATNLKKVESFFVDAHEQHVDLLVLPENFALMASKETNYFTYFEPFGLGEIQEKISQLAKRYGIWVIAGTIPLEGSSARVRASSLVFDNTGRCVARYDKIHLFDVSVSENEIHQESLTIERGHELVVVDTPIGCVGLTVCYDLRFPELYQGLAAKGADLFSIPSAFTEVTGKAHWQVLLRARAIENLCYVIAPNQGGYHENGRKTYGHSSIVEPWGAVVAQCEAGAGMIIADIDLPRLQQLRRQFPCNKHHILKAG